MAFSDLPMQEKLQLLSDIAFSESASYDESSFLCVDKESR